MARDQNRSATRTRSATVSVPPVFLTATRVTQNPPNVSKIWIMAGPRITT